MDRLELIPNYFLGFCSLDRIDLEVLASVEVGSNSSSLITANECFAYLRTSLLEF